MRKVRSDTQDLDVKTESIYDKYNKIKNLWKIKL